ncbi:DUF429 domain-containing protein [Amnibacterium flavum]|uniref:DUF429 domain-containing protein n=1 Tax=Amnibacterium flavum TaxID=2173173 RepID=A0A2V1HSS4_9MICO|nr:DUF429 domain-containing protein [Amnibacterium flavum]PVZ95666.1 DUF429 domain-containing protein [Amnibacterium flavum]
MLTAGVDLAAESRGTALAVIEWRERDATVRELHLDVHDPQIVATAHSVEKLGIDCAFGWPDDFVAFVAAHATLAPEPAAVDGGMEWRRTLAYRETDRRVRARVGRWPLSVSTDRLGLTAMRCAGLLARLRESGFDVDRSGTGKVAEVYPGASIRLWGFLPDGYRADPAARERLLAALLDEAPWLRVEGHAPLMVRSADAFDAVIAALAARAAVLGLFEGPPPELEAVARREGWVALPDGSIGDLVG